MTQQEFLEWLDKQIAIATTRGNSVKPHEVSIEADQFRIRAKTLQQVRDNFVTVMPPPMSRN